MEDLFISVKEIENELKKIESEAIELDQKILILNQKLSLLSDKIESVFFMIKTSENIESANSYFELLDKIQFLLARAVFEDGIKISDRLYQFVQDFDNLPFYQKYYFDKIKSGEYSF